MNQLILLSLRNKNTDKLSLHEEQHTAGRTVIGKQSAFSVVTVSQRHHSNLLWIRLLLKPNTKGFKLRTKSANSGKHVNIQQFCIFINICQVISQLVFKIILETANTRAVETSVIKSRPTRSKPAPVGQRSGLALAALAHHHSFRLICWSFPVCLIITTISVLGLRK